MLLDYQTPPVSSDWISVQLRLPDQEMSLVGQARVLCDTPQAEHGSCRVEADGSISYLSQDGFLGIDKISFSYKDRSGQVHQGRQTIRVEAAACFTPGTRIATPKGERRVEELKAGDQIITRDNGIQKIRWVGAKRLVWRKSSGNAHLKPILIKAGALGDGLPENDMMVSPNHRLMVSNERTALFFAEQEAFVAAKSLIDNAGITRSDTVTTTYYHFMCDAHQVVLSNGAWSESFQPSDNALKAVGNAQRLEILELFPALKTQEGQSAYKAARKTLLGPLSERF